MCGIVGGLGVDPADVERALALLHHRGPDGSAVEVDGSVVLGHARLSIIDPTPASDQPFRRGSVLLAYNGECWGYRSLRAELEGMGERFQTSGDTEVVAAALDRWGVEALDHLDGMFALAWTVDGEVLHLARDRFGEVPLHVRGRWFASEVKALAGLAGPTWSLGPGERVEVAASGVTRHRWYEPANEPAPVPDPARAVRASLEEGTRLRAVASDVPSCTLLSGGIDSAAVALHLKAELPSLVAYTAVLDPKSRDLRCARSVAEALGLELREVKVLPPSADDLSSVVREIEMPHKAQVEIGWACLQLAEAMRGDGFKVAYSGEGSDELWGSYGFSYHGIAKEGWHGHRKRLVLDQARKNFARCNKVFMARSVEVRLPFLHRPLVELALGLPREQVAHGGQAKAVLADGHPELPPEVLRRPKVAFQDGMGLKDACAVAVASPARFYRAEYQRMYPSAA